MAEWDSGFGRHGEHFAGTENQDRFRSKVLGMSKGASTLQRNQPLQQRPSFMSRRGRAGNRARKTY